MEPVLVIAAIAVVVVLSLFSDFLAHLLTLAFRVVYGISVVAVFLLVLFHCYNMTKECSSSIKCWTTLDRHLESARR
jgi:hypothetical protein